MDRAAKIYVAGHRGMVGSAIVRALRAAGHAAIVTRTSAELDLRDGAATRAFLAAERPATVVMAAAREGGGAGRGASVRAQAISSRAHTPSDVGADRIDNKLSIPLWKQVNALVEMPKHW